MATSTPPKSSGEYAATIFSYAQAAKGRSPSVPDTATETDKPLTKRTSSEGQIPSGDGLELKTEPEITSPEKTNKSSVPSSPDFGTASTSTLPKDDDPFLTQNGSSESTWDKQSENSQNGSKNTQKPDADKQHDEAFSWSDDVPAPSALKDAPLPTVNYWQQRKEAQEAKTNAHKSLGVQPNKTAESNTHSVGVVKNSNGIKQDSQRKHKGNPINQETNPPSGNMRDGARPADGKMRNTEEGKASGRIGRVAEVQKPNLAIPAPLPPPGDATSWPTPDSAQDEEKKKAQERAGKVEKDKVNAPAPKPHGKEKWTAIPFVPSAVFSTPIPQMRRGGGGRPSRGGRDGGPGRGGHPGSPGNDNDRPGTQGGVANQPSAVSNDRGRADLNSSKSPSTGAKTKRSVSAGPAAVREQRKVGDLAFTEKRKEQETNGPKRNAHQVPIGNEARGSSAGTNLDKDASESPKASKSSGYAVGQPTIQKSPVNAESGDRRQSAPFETHTYPRTSMSDRRSEVPRSFEYSRDFFGQNPVRERGEGRPERGRGGYRGRGNGNHGFVNPSYVNGNSYANGHAAPHAPPMMPPTKSQPTHERHPSQSQGSTSSPSHSHPRSLRSNSRSQSIPHATQYGRYSNGPYAGAPHLANIQTDIANAYGYQPGNQGPLSAVPYSPFADQVGLYGMVSMQMEYYFSLDNLCKDLFLRKHMDSQGFVFLSVLANFNRIRQLTQDMDLIRLVCLNSVNIEIRTGADGIDRLRKQEGWQQWVLSIEDRDPSAQNEGPTQLQQPRLSQPPLFTMPYGYEEISETPSTYNPLPHMVDNGLHKQVDGVNPSGYVANDAGPIANGDMGDRSTIQAPNVAADSDFTPGLPPSNGHGCSPIEPQAQNVSSFTDEQVESLMIVVRKPISTSAVLPPPFHSASSRTFSNGSIDGRTISDELSRYDERQSRPSANSANGHQLNELNAAHRARSPFSISSPKPQATSNASPVFWVKDKDTPIDSLPIDLTHESYNGFRVNAMQQREQSGPGACHRDMDILYQFWSHFLIRNFNTRMYDEFRRTASEDASQRDSKVGLKNLVQYYDESMLGQKVMTDDIARDYVDLVKGEGCGPDRPAFDKLRSAWRNGATNMKNRKKIGDVLDADLKAKLER